MSEKAKFYNMTKPVRFRRLKQAKMITVLWCKAVRERIIYLFNHVLYKLNILKRYSYRDRTEQVFSLPFNIKMREVQSNTFKGVVVTKLIKETFYDIDYFYRQKKDGSKKITLTLKDEEESRLYTESHLEEICLKVSSRWYMPDHLPTLKVAVMDVKPVAFDPSASLKPVEYDTVEYDLLPLKTLRYKSLLGKITLNDISEPMLYYYYELAVSEFSKKLNSMTLHDLMK